MKVIGNSKLFFGLCVPHSLPSIETSKISGIIKIFGAHDYLFQADAHESKDRDHGCRAEASRKCPSRLVAVVKYRGCIYLARVFTAFLFLSQNTPPRQYRLHVNSYNISELVVGFASLLFSTWPFLFCPYSTLLPLYGTRGRRLLISKEEFAPGHFFFQRMHMRWKGLGLARRPRITID